MQVLLAEIQGGLAKRQRQRHFRITGAVVGLLAALLVAVQSQRPQVANLRCSGGLSKFTAVWRPEIFEALTPAFARSQPTQASWSRVGERLSAYSSAWTSAYQQVCGDHLRHEQTPTFDHGLFDQKMNCLEQARAQLGGLVHGWQSDGAPAADRAIAAVYRLPEPAFCLNRENLQNAAPLPIDPVKRREVEALREAIVRLIGQWDAGHHESSLHGLLALKPAVHQLADYALQAELASTIGLFYMSLSARTNAQVYLEQALALARAGRYGKIAARSAIALIYARVYQGGELEHAQELTNQARASLASSGDLPEYLASYYNQLGIVASLQGQTEQCLRWFDQAYQQNVRFRGVEHPMSATYLSNLAEAHYSLQHLDQAEQLTRKVMAIASQIYGDTHPEMMEIHRTYGLILANQGRYDEADENLQASVDLCRFNYHHTPEACGELLAGIAQKLLETGSDDRAAAILTELDTGVRRDLTAIDETLRHISWALIASQRGDWHQAETRLIQAQRAQARLEELSHPSLAWLDVIAAEVEVSKQQPEAALQRIARIDGDGDRSEPSFRVGVAADSSDRAIAIGPSGAG